MKTQLKVRAWQAVRGPLRVAAAAKPRPTPPKTLGELILLACNDVEAVAAAGVGIDMAHWASVADGKCHVCFAGAVLVSHAGIAVKRDDNTAVSLLDYLTHCPSFALQTNSVRPAGDENSPCAADSWNSFYFYALDSARRGSIGRAMWNFSQARSAYNHQPYTQRWADEMLRPSGVPAIAWAPNSIYERALLNDADALAEFLTWMREIGRKLKKAGL